MTYEASIKIEFHSKWEPSLYSDFDDEMLPEENITMEIPAEDLNTTQLFRFFGNFMRSIGHNELGIMKGACALAFNDFQSDENMNKICEVFDLVMKEDVEKLVDEGIKDALTARKEWENIHENRLLGIDSPADNCDNWEELYWALRRITTRKIKELNAAIEGLQAQVDANDGVEYDV